MNQTLIDFFRIREESFRHSFSIPELESEKSGFFRFGNGNICYGRSRTGVAPSVETSGTLDASQHVQNNGANAVLPFSFTEVIENLRLERYRSAMVPGRESFATTEMIRELYYFIRGSLPFAVRRQFSK